MYKVQASLKVVEIIAEKERGVSIAAVLSEV